jgi:hypothetical protein
MPDGANAYPANEQAAYESPMSVAPSGVFLSSLFFIFLR